MDQTLECEGAASRHSAQNPCDTPATVRTTMNTG